MLKVAITHDVDRTQKTYQFITHSLKALSDLDFSKFANQVKSIFLPDKYWGFDELINIESGFNIKSTFFFLNESLSFDLFSPSNWELSLGRYNINDSKITDIIIFLDKHGWEIGLHGSFNSYKDRKLLLREKEILENILGHEIIGTRQHYLNLTDSTWNIQSSIGLKYDTSWGLNKDIGFKDNKIKPFRPFKNEFLVIPMTIMDTPFVNNKNKWENLKRIIDKIIEEDSILVINWHTNYYDESEFPNYKSDFIKIIEECKNYNATFYTLKEYYSQFQYMF